MKPPLAILLACLCTASLVCEAMRAQAGGAVQKAHQARWDCLSRETAKVSRCVESIKQGPRDDADFCEEAVARCKANGTYGDADQADARYDVWLRLSRWLRVVLIAGAIAWLAWSGIVQPIRRKRRTTLP